MRARVQWTTQGERELVVDEALGLLERAGMRFGTCKALDTLADAGAHVDRAAGVARLPRELVTRVLAQCPRDVLLAGATPADDCLLDGAGIHFAPSGTPTQTLDFETGGYRLGTLEDARRSTIVADAMPVIDVMWPLVTATDVSGARHIFADLLVGVSWSAKHLQHEVTASWHVEPMLRLMEILCGSLEEFRRRPRLCCSTSPLAVDSSLLDATIAVARYGAPIVVYPMPIAGATAPVTVAGTVSMDVAEFLGVATAIGTGAPGARLILGAGTSLLDMRATTYSLAALETALMAAACVEVGHHLGVPVLAPGLSSDAKYGGFQAGFEKALKGLVVASSGADLITGGIGLLSGANIMSLPQIVMDAEVATMIRRLLAETEISSHTVMGEAMERLGFSGDYLREKETRRRVRAGEHFFPTVASRLSLEMWQKAGQDELAVASEKVRELVAAADARVLPAETIAQLDAVVTEAADDAGARGLA